MVILKVLSTIGLAAFCGWFFRLGGSANTHARWLRQVGVGITELATLAIWFGWSWWMILIMGLAFTESTYFKKKGTDAVWWNWLLTGLNYSLIPLPLLFTHQIFLKGFLIRLVILTPLIMVWRLAFSDVDWEEGGAGALQILTIPLLCIS